MKQTLLDAVGGLPALKCGHGRDRALMKHIVNDAVESFYGTAWTSRKRIIVPGPPSAQLE